MRALSPNEIQLVSGRGEDNLLESFAIMPTCMLISVAVGTLAMPASPIARSIVRILGPLIGIELATAASLQRSFPLANSEEDNWVSLYLDTF